MSRNDSGKRPWNVEEDSQEEEEDADEEEEGLDPFEDPIKDPTYQQAEEHDEEQISTGESLEDEDTLRHIGCAFTYAISADLNLQHSAERRWRFEEKLGCSSPSPWDSWISRALSSIHFSVCMLSLKALHAPKPTHLELREFCKATLTLLEHIETAIDDERDVDMESHRWKLEEYGLTMVKKRQEAQGKLGKERAKCKKLKRKFAHCQKSALAESERRTCLLRQATEETSKQAALFEREKELLKFSHMQEIESWKASHHEQLKELNMQLEKERQNVSCSACNRKPRDAVVIPCLHLDFCFECLLQLRDVNSNKCPACAGPIEGVCMSTYGAS